MHNAWQKTLDTKELNKRFFQELANWYFWAMDYVEFPDDIEKRRDVRNATNLIRLITRMVFIWFIKEKDLVPDVLFNKNYLNKILKDFNMNEKSDSYYNAILQNLFFGTLNQKIGERGFAREGSFTEHKNEYGVKNLFRYADKFTLKENNVVELFKDIPFLNGGLFDCLDKPNEEGKILYVDGFSRNNKKQAKAPDFLFFSDEREVDLNEIFGTKNKKYKVKGLINLLDSYKFTITENTPIEEEIALDPELLGKVFENLLANYNPETQTTARKQTGSFYTPREIVNYMVDESLIAYLKQSLSSCNSIPSGHSASSCHSLSSCHSERSEESNDLNKEMLHSIQHDKNEERLRDLLSYSENPNPFNAQETSVLINAIDTCKILDPACGSGAFPMGILHKMVHMLYKLDPYNVHWKHQQLSKVDKLIEEAEGISDTRIREKVIEDLQNTRRDIEEAFDNNELDYGRKLYLIENCIYGVDIQPIAVQIARLRFFISLIVDQKVNPRRENLGIRPLLNLETKFVAANTLIGLVKEQANLFTNPNIEKKKGELKKVRHDYFEARTPKRKENCRIKDRQLRDELAELLIQNHDFQPVTAKKIAAWDPYDQNTSATFFDSEWMFGVKEGFDVVIGNPPYGAEVDDIDSLAKNYKHFDRQKNSASFFIEVGNRLTNSKGVISYIIPKSLSFSEGWKKTRELVTHKNRLLSVIDVCKAFEAVLLEQIIICVSKENAGSSYQFSVGEGWDGEIKVRGKGDNKLTDQLDILPMYIDNRKQDILNKLQQDAVLLSEISKTFRGLPFQRKISRSGQPILRGKNIGKYKIYGDIDNITLPKEVLSSAKIKELLKPKILSQNIVAHVMNPYDRIIIMATIDTEGLLTLDTVMNTYLTADKFALQYVLAILNSQLASWFYYWFVFNRAVRTMHFDKYYIDNLPVKGIDLKAQHPFIALVDQILTAKKKKPNTDTSVLEQQIDEMVYKLYGLTPEEIAIVEGRNKH